MSELAFLDIDSSKKGLIRAGAIAFVVVGILLVINEIIIFLLTFGFLSRETTITYGISTTFQAKLAYAFITPVQPPSNIEGAMQFIVNNLTFYRIGYPLEGAISLVLLIGIPALYVSLRKIKPTPIVLASLFALIFQVVGALSSGIASTLIGTSLNYVHSTSDFQRAAYVAVFQNTLGIANTYRLVSNIVLGLAFLTFSVVMLKSQKLKLAGVFGIAAILFGLISTIALFGWNNVDLGQIGAILHVIWYFMLAYSLWRVSSDTHYQLT